MVFFLFVVLGCRWWVSARDFQVLPNVRLYLKRVERCRPLTTIIRLGFLLLLIFNVIYYTGLWFSVFCWFIELKQRISNYLVYFFFFLVIETRAIYDNLKCVQSSPNTYIDILFFCILLFNRPHFSIINYLELLSARLLFKYIAEQQLLSAKHDHWNEEHEKIVQ